MAIRTSSGYLDYECHEFWKSITCQIRIKLLATGLIGGDCRCSADEEESETLESFNEDTEYGKEQNEGIEEETKDEKPPSVSQLPLKTSPFADPAVSPEQIVPRKRSPWKQSEVTATRDPWAQTYKFECGSCGKKFNVEKAYKQHIKVCKCGQLECKSCGKRLSSIKLLNNHMDTFHGTLKWRCPDCTERFLFKEELIKHFTAAHDERPYKCPNCDKTFKEEENMKLHATTHKKGCQPCGVCGKILSGKSALYLHMKMHNTAERFTCDQCDSKFTLKQNLKFHVRRVHGPPLICKHCGAQIKGLTSMRKHLLVMHGEKMNYKCDLCDATFTVSYELQAHRKCHTLAHQCDLCGKTFDKRSSLEYHIERHSDEKKYPCPKCGKRFTVYNGVQKHMRAVHAESRDYNCDVCGKAFKMPDVLKKHRLIHDNERKFKCNICGKGFNASGSLWHHKKTHLKWSD